MFLFVWNYGDLYYVNDFHSSGPYFSVMMSKLFYMYNYESIDIAVSSWFCISNFSVFTYEAIKRAAVLIYLAPVLVMYFIVQKRLVENFEQSGIVG